MLYVELPDSLAYDRLETRLGQNPDVKSISGSIHHLGSDHASKIIYYLENQYEVDHLSVGPTYFQTMDLQLSAGRFFKEDAENDKTAIIVNELFIKNLGVANPVGEIVEMNDLRYEIVGVVSDFHLYNFYYEVLPTMFTLADERDYKYMEVKAEEASQPELYASIKKEWPQLYPEIPFQGGFQAQLWDGFYKDLQTQKVFSRTIAIIAILLSSLGLYGLVTLNVSGRVREFSVRKVLGAGGSSLMKNVGKQ